MKTIKTLHLNNILIICFILITLVFSTSCTKQIEQNESISMDKFQTDNGTIIAAHRGYAAIAPENTIASFQAAVDYGADACEFDVQISKDGTLIVMHDDSVDRTTNGEGKISKLTDEYLRTLDAGSWKGQEFKGEKIPTLEETLIFLKQNNMVALLEIKASSIADAVVELLYQTEMESKTLIISFDEKSIKNIKENHPEIPAVLLLPKRYMFGAAEIKAAKIMSKAKKIGTTDIGPFSFQMEDLTDEDKDNLSKGVDPGELVLALDSETISILHKNGYRIDAWTVDSVENIKELIKSNVDVLTTNYLETAINAKNEILNE